jgi:hypothetical protein
MFYSSLSGMGLASRKGQAAYDVTEARGDATEAKSEAVLLKHDVDRLMMITEALWTFLKKEHGYSDDELAKAISAIDLGTAGRTRTRRKNARRAAGWCRNTAGFAFIAAIRFRKACLNLEILADGHSWLSVKHV